MDNLRVYISTWNVATNPPNVDLNALLDFPSVTNSHRPLPDFYVLGFQEVNSQPHNLLMDSISVDPWTKLITDILVKHKYVRVKYIRLQGLLLVVFGLHVHTVHIRDLQTQYTKTGLGGLWGNKGAVSIRFSIYGCSLCFVNSHLTAHDHLLEDRINDYNNIISTHSYSVENTSNILYHDYVFWLGDLNFRLTEDSIKTPEEVSDRVRRTEKDNYVDILKHDQLTQSIESGAAFSELKESPPGFPPTYKFIIGTNEYDLKRRPAWTDRILYKVSPNNYDNVTLSATQLRYSSLPQYTLSDHKPVVSEFTVKYRMKRSSLSVPPKRFITYSDGIPRNKETDSEEYDLQDDMLAHPDMEHKVNQAQLGSSPTEIFSNYTERCVEFLPIKNIWSFGDADLVIKFTLSKDVVINSGDWIGVYEADFDNLDEYITYEYIEKANTVVPTGPDATRMIVFSFPVGSGVRSPGFYKFLYFSQPSSDVRSVLGMSESFEVRDPSNKNSSMSHINYDAQSPSTSSSSSQPSTSSSHETSKMESLVRDLRKIHVPGMRLDMLNDLSID